MKIAVYSCREDERGLFEDYARQMGAELSITESPPAMENLEIAKGCQAVSVITTPVSAGLLDRWKDMGILAVSTRTVGYEHIDWKHAYEIGVPVSNVSYTPHTVAEYTVMAMLMAVRRMKAILTRYQVQDYSLTNVRGRELCRMTVGVVGTGQIGEAVIRNLSGFGCRLLANDIHEKDEVKEMAEYTDIESIWRECDLITFHTPALPETYHMVNRDSLGKMKRGVILINMARGSVIDTGALIEALESGQVGAAALDVLEDEGRIYYRDYKYEVTRNHDLAVLSAMPNVLMTPHTAFFTDEAVGDMIRYSLESCIAEVEGRPNPRRVGGGR